MRKIFRKYGIDEAFLSEKLGKKVESFDVEGVKAGTNLRAYLYRLKISYADGSKGVLFAKDCEFSTGVSTDLVSILDENKGVLIQNEIDYLRFGMGNGLFTPQFFGSVESKDNGDSHNVILLESWDKSLEEKLLEISNQMKETGEEEKKKLENLAVDYVRRSLDIVLINNYLASVDYQAHGSIGSAIIYDVTEEWARDCLRKYLESLLAFKFGNTRSSSVEAVYDTAEWLLSYTDVFDTLTKLVAKPLARHLEEAKKEERRGSIINLDLHPGNILIKEGKLPEYDPNAVLHLRNGRKGKTPYDNLAVTDNSKMGIGPYEMTLSLIHHPTVLSVLPPEKITQLTAHVLVQQEKLLRGEEIHLESLLDTPIKREFDDLAAAVGRFASLRAANFDIQYYLNYREPAEDFIKRSPIYNPRTFVNMIIDHITSLEDPLTPYFKKTNLGLIIFKS